MGFGLVPHQMSLNVYVARLGRSFSVSPTSPSDLGMPSRRMSESANSCAGVCGAPKDALISAWRCSGGVPVWDVERTAECMPDGMADAHVEACDDRDH